MLRTSQELLRYGVEGRDGPLGSVDDFLVDDRSWAIRHIVVETGDFLSHHEVLIDPGAVDRLKFPEEMLTISMSKQAVEESPGIETSLPVSRQGEAGGAAGRLSESGVSLRSAKEIGTYQMHATDAVMGNVHGLIIDTSSWRVRYFVVDTGDFLDGRLVLLSPEAINKIDWPERRIYTGLSSEKVRHSPEYDGDAQLTRDYEAFLHFYYGWPHYWSD